MVRSMAAIYNDPRYQYHYATTANTNTVAINGGTTINGQTFATPGTYTITPTFYWEDIKVTPTAIEVAEALFEIKPSLRKKYKGCAADLVKDIIAAGEGKKSWNAAKKLGTVLGLED